ncbi:adenylate kinase-domain-containing protein [Cantharellus anzutake]|uniref:adenylate kinase-domain-containing protein n=1 Tax=Cantharellus anzutake TaxID=1750568 RepID=UPI0019065A1B|nr:adenylate kinase-domain-containing protein [Cantharellus anzutake]KAF8343988.1 adenylate kinase-domain-containing protein [Cantharellus anzutake]
MTNGVVKKVDGSGGGGGGEVSSIRRPLRMIMFGKPGSGKGTLSSKLVEKYDIEPISTGDLLRAEVRARTEIGLRAESIMASGGILDDELVLQLVSNKLGELRERGNWILDGFPRTLGQGRLLDPLLRKLSSPLSLIINLDVPDEEILNRIADRWTHAKSGRVYNLGYNKPKVPGRDDVTGEPLTKRPDDNPEVASKRLKTFYETTSPLLHYYATQSISPNTGIPTSPNDSLQPQMYLMSIQGRSSDEMWPKIEEFVRRLFGVRGRGIDAAMGGTLGVGGKGTARGLANVAARDGSQL